MAVPLLWFLSDCAVIVPPPHQGLTEVATLVARALYRQAGGAEERLASINADNQTVQTGVCYIVMSGYGVKAAVGKI